MNKVQVLMSTYNGETFLVEQIESLLAQEGVKVEILVRDDGSKDQTKNILDSYQKKGLLRWYDGENLRSAKSFMNLIQNATEADYYAFCDQDDVWDIDKLKIAIDFLSKSEKDSPSIYFSNTQLVDAELKPLYSPVIENIFTFGESLLRNSAVGCTVVFNPRLMFFLKQYIPSNLWMHDAWAYQLCLALDGNVYFDDMPHIKYRQHGNNVVGGNESILSMIKRMSSIYFKDKGGIRMLNVLELLNGFEYIIPEHNKILLQKLAHYKKSLLSKVEVLKDVKFKTESLSGRFGFFMSILFNRF